MTPYSTQQLLSRLYGLSLLDESAIAPSTGARNVMVGAISSVKGVLVEFLATILPNIARKPTREALIELHQIIR